MRFVDAVAELDGAGGLRVHRSYWVARRHVDGRRAPGGPHHAPPHRRPRGAGEPHLHVRGPHRRPSVSDGEPNARRAGPRSARRRSGAGRRGSATVSRRSMQAAWRKPMPRGVPPPRLPEPSTRTIRAGQRAGPTLPSAMPRRAMPARARRAFRRALQAWEAAEAWVARMDAGQRARSSGFPSCAWRRSIGSTYDALARAECAKLLAAGRAAALGGAAHLARNPAAALEDAQVKRAAGLRLARCRAGGNLARARGAQAGGRRR